MSASRRTGQISPVTLLAPVTASRAGPRTEESAARTASTASSGVAGAGRRTGEGQGNRLAWCSPSKTTVVVPAGSARASRFSASVVLRVKITASPSRAPTNSATVSRARSYSKVERWERRPAPRWTLP
jgi:hypothetical protein